VTLPKTGMTQRNNLVLAGFIGLLSGVTLTTGAVWVVSRPGFPILVTGRTGILGLLVFVLFFSLVEIPLMLYALRHMASNQSAGLVTLAVVALFVFFAAFYAAPFTLLTGQKMVGILLAGLCLVRLACVFIFLPGRIE
jgi:LPXTG-motif cell wall-anchored protein